MFSNSATVTGADGRTWQVRQTMEWMPSIIGDDYEHDEGSGIIGATIGLVGICGFWVGILGWFPGGQHVPLWVKIAAVIGGLLLLAVLPLRWFLGLAWTMVAETAEDEDRSREKWVGLVRTRATADEEFELIVRSLRTTGTPQYESGVLYELN